MIRLLIADDEGEERMGIRFLLKRYGFAFEIAEAADGAEALALLRKQPADILLTDVKMPFLTGIELAREARQLLPELQIIFFSGYDDFEYVKQALSLQAVDYILKPVNPSEFQKTISLVIERVRREEEEQNHSRRYYNNYILTRLLNQTPYEKLKEEYKEKALGFLKDYRRLILLEFGEDVFGKEISDIMGFAAAFRDIIPGPYDFLDLTPAQGVFFLKGLHKEDAYVREVAKCIQLQITKEYGRRCYLGISPEIGSAEDIGKLYGETESCLEERFFYQDEFIYPLNEGRKRQAGGEADAGTLLQAIEKDAACRDFYSLRRDMDILIGQCRDNCFQSYIYTRFICANLLRILFKDSRGAGGCLAERVEQLYACSHFGELEKMLWAAVEELEREERPEEDSTSHTVALVEQYIKEHFEEALSLDILAEKVFLTPHYLSSIFIQEKGIGINKYIKNVRMERARELLANTNMKISDVCVKAGYANLSYFCRSFRNEYGVTPDQYRSRKD